MSTALGNIIEPMGVSRIGLQIGYGRCLLITDFLLRDVLSGLPIFNFRTVLFYLHMPRDNLSRQNLALPKCARAIEVARGR